MYSGRVAVRFVSNAFKSALHQPGGGNVTIHMHGKRRAEPANEHVVGSKMVVVVKGDGMDVGIKPVLVKVQGQVNRHYDSGVNGASRWAEESKRQIGTYKASVIG